MDRYLSVQDTGRVEHIQASQEPSALAGHMHWAEEVLRRWGRDGSDSEEERGLCIVVDCSAQQHTDLVAQMRQA